MLNLYKCRNVVYFCQVLYVDYGNKEVVSKSDLRVLDAEFMADRVQIYCCRLHDVTPVMGFCSPFIKCCCRMLGAVCCQPVDSCLLYTSPSPRD